MAELIQLVHDLSDLTPLDTADTFYRYFFGYIPKINGSGLALTCCMCPTDFNVKAVAEVTVNTTLKVDAKNAIVGAKAFAKGVLLNITLAKKLCEDPLPKLKKKLAELDSDERSVILTCPICGRAFVRKGKGSRRIYCGTRECEKRRLAQNTRNTRKRQKIAALQIKGTDTE